MKFLLKILFAPVIVILTLVIWLFALILRLSAWVFGIIGTILGLLGLAILLLDSQPHRFADVGSLDDWADAEIPLLRTGCGLRIKQPRHKLCRSENGTGVASATSVFYIEGGERLSPQHALLQCTLKRENQSQRVSAEEPTTLLTPIRPKVEN